MPDLPDLTADELAEIDELAIELAEERIAHQATLARLAEAEKERDEASDALQGLAQDHYFARAEAAEAERDRLRELLAEWLMLGNLPGRGYGGMLEERTRAALAAEGGGET